MAYKKRGYRRRKTAWYKKKYSVGDMAKKALSTALWAKSMLNVEKKFFDTEDPSGQLSILGTTGSIVRIPSQEGAVDQGQARDGDQVRVKSIYWKGQIDVNPASTIVSQARIMLILDKKANAGQASVTSVLESASCNSLMNLGNRNRYKVLMDRKFTITPIAGGKAQVFFYFYRKCSYKLQWSSDTTDEPENVNIFYLLITDTGTNPPAITSTTRVRFIDN